jgi:hypothetical protein
VVEDDVFERWWLRTVVPSMPEMRRQLLCGLESATFIRLCRWRTRLVAIGEELFSRNQVRYVNRDIPRWLNCMVRLRSSKINCYQSICEPSIIPPLLAQQAW